MFQVGKSSLDGQLGAHLFADFQGFLEEVVKFTGERAECGGIFVGGFHLSLDFCFGDDGAVESCGDAAEVEEAVLSEVGI